MHDHHPAEVVLVHGLWYGSPSMVLLRRRLVRAGWRCRIFRYRTLRRSLAANARELQDFVAETGAPVVHMVGHSLGGLVILRALDKDGGLPPGRVVLLGAPVRGSAVAARAVRLGLTRPLVGKAGDALETGFCRAPAGRETGVIAGTFGLGLGLVLRGLEERHDGTVNLSETELPGTARLELPVSHTGLVLSRRVAAAVIRFLERGEFPVT